MIEAGDKITEGPIDPKELLRIAGVQEVEKYILKEVKKVYASQGIDISDKHIEVMIRQMLRKVVVVEGNGTNLNPGVQISLPEMTKINRNALLSGKQPAVFSPVLLGISKASVETDSFLSAASFQETTKVLTEAAIKGKKDYLMGLKENVIIGKLIPAGTGCNADRETSRQIEELAAELRAERISRSSDEDESEVMNFSATEKVNEDVIQEMLADESLSVVDAEE